MSHELSTKTANRDLITAKETAMKEGIMKTLPSLPRQFFETKDSLFDGYTGCASDMRERNIAFNDWMYSIVDTNTKHKVYDPKTMSDYQVMSISTLKNTGDLRIPRFKAESQLAVASHRIAKLEQVEEVRKALSDQLQADERRLVNTMVTGLNGLSKVRNVGRVEWFSSRVCKLSFFENELVDDVRYESRRHGRASHHIVKVTDRTFVSTQVTHDVERTRLHKVGSVKVPDHVENLLSHTPDWIKPHLRIITGKEIGEDLVTNTFKVATWEEPAPPVARVSVTFSHDPALVLGPFVICGWR